MDAGVPVVLPWKHNHDLAKGRPVGSMRARALGTGAADRRTLRRQEAQRPEDLLSHESARALLPVRPDFGRLPIGTISGRLPIGTNLGRLPIGTTSENAVVVFAWVWKRVRWADS